MARHVYARAAAAGKRAQCQGGAKNPVVVLPDADLWAASDVIADSAFGCAGQAAKIKPIPLEKMAERYAKGELSQIVK